LDNLPSFPELRKSAEWANLHFEAFQIILRQQVTNLIALGFPTEFERVVKQLWSVFANKLLQPPRVIKKRKLVPTTSEQLVQQLMESVHSDSAPDSPTDSPTDSAADSTQETKQSVPIFAPGSHPAKGRVAIRKRQGLGLSHSLLLLHLSAVYLRLPIVLRDMHRFAESGKIPYLTAGRILPDEMQQRLQVNNSMFVPESVPSISSLHDAEKTLIRQLATSIEFPSSNVPLLLARMVDKCRLSSSAYWNVKKLAQLCGYIPVFGQRWAPEVRLAALVLLAFPSFNVDDAWRDALANDVRDEFGKMDVAELIHWAERNEEKYLAWLRDHVFEPKRGSGSTFDAIVGNVWDLDIQDPLPPAKKREDGFRVLKRSLEQFVGADLDPVLHELEKRLSVEKAFISSLD